MKEKQIEKTKKNMADFFAKIKNLSKKNKIVLLCIAVFIVLVSAGGITAAVLLARANVPPRPSGEFFTADYYQAIRPNDPTGIKLNDTWMRGYDFQYFRYESDNENLFVSDRMVLTSGPFVEWTDCLSLIHI